MQRAREHRMERQLHVAQIVSRAEQRVKREKKRIKSETLCKNFIRVGFSDSDKMPSQKGLAPSTHAPFVTVNAKKTLPVIFGIKETAFFAPTHLYTRTYTGINAEQRVRCHGSLLFLLPPGMPRRDAPVLCLFALLFGYSLCKPAQNLI
ncbi:hypothetical protein X777_15512 [Ooceraea biroi]|uniref:Uncharacterized protein n=1 Tax=Ooceraea biroi TaxID=2015173 RepID=A0A026VXD3_OOCBI|nr:hypothetical protein X777_15512 [Ooceraea biroi]